MKEFNIYNGFGLTPTNTFVSAGMDFYIPNINCADVNQIEIAYNAFKKSYKLDDNQISEITEAIRKILPNLVYVNNWINILHLYLALYNKQIEYYKKKSVKDAVQYFVSNYLTYDGQGKPGIKLRLNDTVFFNSGIKVALPHDYAGLFVNKSGKGNAGYDVRACLVDEDYSGYVHLSMAYTKDLYEDGQNIIYCGDKLTQMMIVPVQHLKPVEIPEENYNNIMAGSQRGADGFGSSDVKH